MQTQWKIGDNIRRLLECIVLGYPVDKLDDISHTVISYLIQKHTKLGDMKHK